MSTITARFTAPGLHRWPGAPDRRAYLRDLHRHLFRVEVVAAMGHNDREVEFHDLAEQAAQMFEWMGSEYHPATRLVTFGARSCEMLAAELAALLTEEGLTLVRVTVSEDGENDGTWHA